MPNLFRQPSCQISGEGESDNPDYCYAFYSQEAESDDEMDCCWTSNHNSVIPNHLNGIAKVFESETMYVYQFHFFSSI